MKYRKKSAEGILLLFAGKSDLNSLKIAPNSARSTFKLNVNFSISLNTTEDIESTLNASVLPLEG